MRRNTTKLGKFESLEAKKLMTADIGLDPAADVEETSGHCRGCTDDDALFGSDFGVSRETNSITFEDSDPFFRSGLNLGNYTGSAEIETTDAPGHNIGLMSTGGDLELGRQTSEASAVDSVFAAGSDDATTNGQDLDIQIRTRGRTGYSDVKRVAIKIGRSLDNDAGGGLGDDGHAFVIVDGVVQDLEAETADIQGGCDTILVKAERYFDVVDAVFADGGDEEPRAGSSLSQLGGYSSIEQIGMN